MSDLRQFGNPDDLPNPYGMAFDVDHLIRRLGESGLPLPPPRPVYPQHTTLGSQIGRWYERAGGLNKAIGAAQDSMRHRDQGVLADDRWPRWRPDAVTSRPAASVTYGDTGKYPPDWEGAYNPRSKGVWVRAQGDQSTLEHELSHAAFMPGSGPNYFKGVDPANSYFGYLNEPAETDVRLAEAKRRYAHATGKLVTTPAEAAVAWEWYLDAVGDAKRAGRLGRPSLVPDGFIGPDAPSHGAQMYDDQWNDEEYMRAMHRMPELVESRIRRLARS